jgi:hypothetical protein
MIENDPTHTELLQQFMRLSKQKQLHFLQRALEDSALWRKGAGVGDDVAEKSRKSLKPDGGTTGGTEKKNDDAVRHDAAIRQAIKETFGVDDAALDRMVEIVEQATDAKAAGIIGNDFVERLKALLAEYGNFWFLDDDEADVVEAMCDHIVELETEIAACEQEAEQLRWEIEQRQKAMRVSEAQTRKQKRSFIEEDMIEPREENEIFLEDNNKHHPNRVMRTYLDRIDADAAWSKRS